MNIRKTLSVLALAALVVSCSDDDNNNETLLSESEIPTEITAYQSLHFPDNPILEAVQHNENTQSYEIRLEGNFELDFDEAFNIIDIDGTTQLPDSVIPEDLLAYASENYAGNVITDWEIELNHQQIGLDNGVELEFEMDGTFIRIDND